MEKKNAIVIPTHKTELSWFERIALEQVTRILGKYDIFFAIPESLQYSYKTNGAKEIRFEDSWFKDSVSYNMLMKNPCFYEQFINYEYILIYQLDAFVFSDKLQYFCDLGYDYIGAPWIDGAFLYKDSVHTIWYVGNGGLSLRKVDSFLNVLRQNQELLVNNRMNEDLFFSSFEGKSFHIAPVSIALEFSFETRVRECYGKNGENIPFGCHAWQKHDLPFWKPWIEEYGYRIPDEMCKGGLEDNNYYESIGRKRITNYWLNEYKQEDLKVLVFKLFGSKEGGYALWGAGRWGQTLCRMLEDAGMPIRVFIDRQQALENEHILGHEVIMPEILKDMPSKYRIIVAVKNGYLEIGTFLNSIGYQYRRDYIYLEDIEILKVFQEQGEQ